jgi:trigger factor
LHIQKENPSVADDKELAGADAAQEQGDSILDQATRRVREQKENIPHTILEDRPAPGSRRALTVELPREEWERRLEEMFREWRKTAHIEGFRPGKAPVKLLQRRFQKEAAGEVVEKIVPVIVHQYGHDKGTTVFGIPAVTDFKSDEGQPVRISFEIEVKPELDPSGYDSVEVEVPRFSLGESATAQRIEEMRMQSATFEEADKAIEENDAAVLDLKVVDAKGRTVEQEANKLCYNFRQVLPAEVADALMGKKAEDTVEVATVNERRKNQQERFTIAVKAVKALKVPELDDEFAKDLGFDSLAALRQSTEENLKRTEERVRTDDAFEAVIAKLVEAHDFEVPQSLRDHVRTDMMRNDMNYLYQTGGVPRRFRGRSRDEYREELERDSSLRVKAMLLIDAIGKKEGIEATDADVEAALEERAKEEGRKPIAIRAAMEKRREFDQFKEQVRYDKVRQFLLSKAKVTFVEPKPEPAETPGE